MRAFLRLAYLGLAAIVLFSACTAATGRSTPQPTVGSPTSVVPVRPAPPPATRQAPTREAERTLVPGPATATPLLAVATPTATQAPVVTPTPTRVVIDSPTPPPTVAGTTVVVALAPPAVSIRCSVTDAALGDLVSCNAEVSGDPTEIGWSTFGATPDGGLGERFETRFDQTGQPSIVVRACNTGGCSTDSVTLSVTGRPAPHPQSSCDPDGPSLLSVAPLDPKVITSIVPLGRMAFSHVTPTDHTYINHDRPEAFPPPYDVLSPADGILTRIGIMSGHGRPSPDGTGVIEDYRMVIDHSCSLSTIYIHLGGIGPEIMEQIGEIDPDRGWFSSSSPEPVRITAGQVIGKVGPRSFDFSVHDTDVTLEGFVVPERYAGEAWKIHTVDPYDYFTEPVRSELLEKNPRTVAPLGGKIDHDIDGRLVGNWFADGTTSYAEDFGTGYWQAHLAIAYDHVDPDQVRIAIGANEALDESRCSVCWGVYAVGGNGPDPATISVDSGLVKYELFGRLFIDGLNERTRIDQSIMLGVILVQMTDDRTIRMELFADRTAAQVAGFTDAAILYRR